MGSEDCGGVVVHMTTSGDRLQPQDLTGFSVPLTPELRTGAHLWGEQSCDTSLSWFQRDLRPWSSQNTVRLWEAIEAHLSEKSSEKTLAYMCRTPDFLF